MNNWLIIIVVGVLLFSTAYGYRRGFIKLSVAIVSMILTIGIVQMATPYVSRFLKEATPLYTTIQEQVKETVSLEMLPPELSVSEQTRVIEDFPLPDILKKALTENNNSEVYGILGVNMFVEYISSYITNIIINAISFLLSFVFIYAIFGIGSFALNIVGKLPGIRGVNKIAGAIFGFGQGLVVIWLLCLIVTAFASTEWGRIIFEQIDDNKLLTYIYNNNMFTKFIMSLVSNLI